MTDLHTHILPWMDDGAVDLKHSVQLLELEYYQGIRNVALTSHYNCEKTSVGKFLEQRKNAFFSLNDYIKKSEININLKLGSEVYFSPQLMKMDVYSLCIDNTDVLLLELPVNYQPQFFMEALSYFQSQGFIPLIAHVERYSYVLRNPVLLADWIKMGAYAQINASTFLNDNYRKKMAIKFLKWGLVHVIASDTHSPDKRPPVIKQALHEIEKHFDNKMVDQLIHNSDALFAGQRLENISIHYPRYFFGWWI